MRNKKNNLIISLTIFVLFIGSGIALLLIKSNKRLEKQRGHQLVFASDSDQNEILSIDKFINLRHYFIYNLTADSLHNLQILEDARKKLNSIKDKHDTINGVHIIIGDNTSYNFYIKSIDICAEKEPHAFAPNKNDIYAWYLYIPPKDK